MQPAPVKSVTTGKNAISPQEKRERQRHRLGLAAAGGAMLFAASAFGAVVVTSHFGADAEEAELVRTVKVKTVPVSAAAAEPVRAQPAAKVVATTEKQPQQEFGVPLAADPRWAKSATPAVSVRANDTAAPGASAFAALESLRDDLAAGEDANPRPEEFETAALDPAEKKPEAVEKPKAEKQRIVASERPASRMAKATADVRLRSAPNDGSAVLGVVPDGAEVGVVACDGWCEVVYAGKRGFVYKRFVADGGPTAAVRRSTEETAREPSQPPAATGTVNQDLNEIGR